MYNYHVLCYLRNRLMNARKGSKWTDISRTRRKLIVEMEALIYG